MSVQSLRVARAPPLIRTITQMECRGNASQKCQNRIRVTKSTNLAQNSEYGQESVTPAFEAKHCTGKVRYATKKAAKNDKKRLVVARRGNPQKNLKAYRCQVCDGFHLGRNTVIKSHSLRDVYQGDME